jgi:hypothetical protein
VHHRGQLLAQSQLEKPGEIEAEDVEHLAVRLAVETLDSPLPPATNGVDSPAGKPHWGKRGVHAVANVLSGLAEADGDSGEIDVPQLGHAPDHVVAEPTHVKREIEALWSGRRRVCTARQHFSGLQWGGDCGVVPFSPGRQTGNTPLRNISRRGRRG